MKYITKYIMSLLLTLVCVSCQDDMFSEMENTVVSKPGQYDLTLEMSFAPVQEVELGSRSAGDRISDISNLYIALFDKVGEFVDDWYFSQDKANWNKVTVSKPKPGGGTDEDQICKVTTSISLPYDGSQMYLVAVANMGNLYQKYDFNTIQEFRAIEFDWDPDWNGIANQQMSGYFTTTQEISPKGTDALDKEGIPTITLNSGVTTLHAWLRRAASKVTVNFDTSSLRENVWIYIKDVRVKDIPRSCKVFDKNTAKAKEELLEDGEIIDYTGGKTDWRLWPSLSKSKTSIEKEDFDVHSPTSVRSLFFYENMQGTGEKDKAQIVDGGATPTYPDGGDPNNKWYKDGMYNGTYVEVNGYYYSTADDNVNSGPITYRFMLGKDIKKDFDVERNHHYKLTLVFKGNANDVDWHIDYKYDKDYYIPETYYISYLYGQRMHLPITIGNLESIMDNKGYVRITALIDKSNWYPDPEAVNGVDYYNKEKVEKLHQGPQTGFLTLKPSEYSRINKNNFVGRGKSGTSGYLLEYWNGNAENNNTPQGNRTFKVTYETKTYIDNKEDDVYQVSIDKSKKNMVFYMPLYTRALFLVKEWSYTGNNPYEEFTRSSEVIITIDVCDNNDKVLRTSTDVVNIVQVPRIFNPKGVYRENGNDTPFNVTLMQAKPGTNGTQYESFLSKGPWSAQIESASPGSNISINGQKAIFGSTDSSINFDINFSSTAGSKTNQYAIILVRYHNFTCNHRIIVRQGYNPDKVSKTSKVKWHCFNLRHGKLEAKSPIETGGLFKYGNLTDAITEANITPAYFNTPAGSRKLEVMKNNSATTTKTWEEFTPVKFKSKTDSYFPNTVKGVIDLNLGGSGKIAFGRHFEELRDNVDTEFGFGICYADKASKTANVGVAGGSYYYADESTHHLGTLGCFVYSKDISNNIFFPAGRTGFGDMTFDGSIRYGGPATYLGAPTIKPLLWRLFQNYGVNYWLGDHVYTEDPWNSSNKGYATSWDINISTFDFNTYFELAHQNLKSGYFPATANSSKAFPIRLVEVNEN